VPEASRILIAMAHAAIEIVVSRQPEAPAIDDLRRDLVGKLAIATAGTAANAHTRRASHLPHG
jgi:hypothetical protein